jgi:hypothetical protein
MFKAFVCGMELSLTSGSDSTVPPDQPGPPGPRTGGSCPALWHKILGGTRSLENTEQAAPPQCRAG